MQQPSKPQRKARRCQRLNSRGTDVNRQINDKVSSWRSDFSWLTEKPRGSRDWPACLARSAPLHPVLPTVEEFAEVVEASKSTRAITRTYEKPGQIGEGFHCSNEPLKLRSPTRLLSECEASASPFLSQSSISQSTNKHLSADLSQCRNDQGSSPWPRPPRSPSQTPPSSRYTHRLLQLLGVGSSNRRQDRHGCWST